MRKAGAAVNEKVEALCIMGWAEAGVIGGTFVG